MSRSITQNPSSTFPVSPGSYAVASVTTTTGFSAGDYVYTTPTGIGTRATGNVPIGSDSPYVGVTWISTGLQSVAFRTVSYGPMVDQGTFSGTTRTFGQNVITTNTVKATTSYHVRQCTLANGNVVLMYNTGSSLFFKVIDYTGATIVAETTIATNLQTSTQSGNFACCTLTSGNIQFAWTSNAGSYEIWTSQYSSAGAVVISGANRSSGIPSPGNFSMAALSGGGSVLLGSNGHTSIIYNPYVHIFNELGNYVSAFTASYGVSGSGQYYVQVVGLPASYGTNIWVYCSQETLGSNSYNPVVGVYSSSSAITSVTLSELGGTSNGETFNMTFSTDGYICAAVWNGSIYCYKLTYTKATNTSGTLTKGAYTYIASGSSGTLQASTDGAVVCIAHTGNSASVSKMTSANVTTSPVNFASNVRSQGGGYPGAFCGASFGSGVVSALYINTSTQVSQSGGASIAATNGSTVLTGSSYTPATGYYLMGVAATTAAANATGQVIVNGTAQLGSTYPTVTTPVYYSFQSTGGDTLFSQRGSVVATTATLRGLEP